MSANAHECSPSNLIVKFSRNIVQRKIKGKTKTSHDDCHFHFATCTFRFISIVNVLRESNFITRKSCSYMFHSLLAIPGPQWKCGHQVSCSFSEVDWLRRSQRKHLSPVVSSIDYSGHRTPSGQDVILSAFRNWISLDHLDNDMCDQYCRRRISVYWEK